MLIAQITDTHVSTEGSVNDRVLRTPEHLERAVAHLNALSPRPDCVLVTGDLVERGDPREYARFRSIADAIAAPTFVVPGNHDGREGMAAAFADRGYLPTDGGFLQYTVEDWPVRLIGLDTIVPGKPSGELCATRLRWLADRLAEAPDRPTIVFMHHPPFETGIPAMDAMGLDGCAALAEIISRYPRVERLICGHVHRPITRRFAGTIASVAPSTAHQLALTLKPAPELATVMEPPGCALHLWLGEGEGVVSHVSVIGHRPRYVLFDGQNWLTDRDPPPGFHPA